ncbi:MAG: bifunctional DNA-formamidopyrimidine glycosylase/DNA-(apurinic or apyrimidinic site) lyase [Zetaproteobacteria bacterium]|nr:MAG: bifunctional DNA-formamidopyrimidine glycosylase/DNA-(apurinic or apyrimidinic site) lyase [Zetaproteobacteria bacterium]
MPELPEVEVIRRALAPRVVGQRIADARIDEPRLTRRRGTPASVVAAIVGRTVRALRRRGKFFLFDLGGESLIVRLGMTGQLLWWEARDTFRPDGHTHARLDLCGGAVVSYRDIRKFGEIFLLATDAVDETLGVGVEPLDSGFTTPVFREICRAGQVRIKPLLLNQRRVAGIGNIYADEALFRARVRPTRRASNLRLDEIRALRNGIRAVLSSAIRHRGSSISDFRDPCGEPGRFAPLHRVYRRHGEPCVVCRTPIRRIVLGQRGTHFCPTCQR